MMIHANQEASEARTNSHSGSVEAKRFGRVLITLMGSLGDVTRGLAIAGALKRQDPSTRITWLVEPKCEGLVRLSPYLDRIVVFKRGSGWRALANVRRELREESYDVALDMQRHLKSGVLTWLSGARRRIGFARQNAKEGNWLFSTERIPAYDEESTNKFEAYQRFLDSLGVQRVGEVPEAGLKGLSPGPVAREVQERCAEYVVLVLGSSWESKNWMAEGYHSLASQLVARGLAVVLLGDASQADLAHKLVAAQGTSPGSGTILNVLGRTSLADLAVILEHARAAVGPDSGPGHIAAAVGTPYVGLFGATAPERTAPVGRGMRVVRASVGCSPCYLRRCPGLGRLCMRLLSVGQVLQELDFILTERAPSSAR